MPDLALITPGAMIASHAASQVASGIAGIDIDTILYRIIGPSSLFLLGVISFFLRRLVKSIDTMALTQAKMVTIQEVEKEKLRSHLADESRHCLFPQCRKEV